LNNLDFTPTRRSKLLKCLRLLASDQVGERAAAAQAAANMAVTFGGWDDVIAPAVDGDLALYAQAQAFAPMLPEWDRQFLAGVGATLRTGGKISDKQRRQLARIVLEAQARAA
jgi:hypothetical protein